MKHATRKRINLSLDNELAEFAQKWSEVTQKPISHLVDDFLRKLRNDVTNMSPERWFDIQHEIEDIEAEEHLQTHMAEYYDEMQKDDAEYEFCKQNPDSERAKRRIAFIKELERRDEAEQKEWASRQAEREKEREEFIERWKQHF